MASRLIARWAQLALGLVIVALGTSLSVAARLGLAPWDVLHAALSARLGISFGGAVMLTGLGVVAVAGVLGATPRPVTILNVVVVGFGCNALLADRRLVALAQTGYGHRLAALLFGLALLAAGTQLYLRSRLGAGPRDGLMVAFEHRLGRPRSTVRAALEISVMCVGAAMGGPVGLGTVLSVVLIGPLFALAARIDGHEGDRGPRSTTP